MLDEMSQCEYPPRAGAVGFECNAAWSDDSDFVTPNVSHLSRGPWYQL